MPDDRHHRHRDRGGPRPTRRGRWRAGVDVDAELVDMGPGIPPMFRLRDPDGNTLYVVERH